MNINEFITSINRKGIAKAENFDVLITRPNGNITIERDMKARIDSTILPGRNINKVDYTHYGIPSHLATSVNYTDLTMQIICDKNLSEKDYLEEWQDTIIGNFRSTGQLNNNMNLSYYKSYVGTVNIYQYDELGKVTYECRLIDAYPTTIGDLQTGWENSTTIHRLSVSFTYRYYQVIKGNR